MLHEALVQDWRVCWPVWAQKVASRIKNPGSWDVDLRARKVCLFGIARRMSRSVCA